jgi:hypothetical protein
MNSKFFYLLLFFVSLTLFSCSPSGTIRSSSTTDQPGSTSDEKLIWKSHDKIPEWAFKEPDISDNYLYFTGISGNSKTEQDAQADALRTALQRVSTYIGSFFQEKYEKVTVSYGLSSQVADPASAARKFEEALTSALTKKVKPKEWYIEKWQRKKPKEIFFLVRLLAYVPKTGVDESYQEATKVTTDDLKKQRDAVADDKAKSQYDNVMKAFDDAAKTGFNVDK